MRRATTLLVGALLLAGCASGAPGPGAVTPPANLPRTIAVLPFISLADPAKAEPARLLARMVHGALSATSYEVLKPQLVEERLVRADLADPRVLAQKDPAEVARILKVDGLLYGEMTHYDRLFLVAYSQVAAGGSIRLVDARDGTTVFERKEVARSHEGGAPTNPFQAVVTVAQTALKMREIELIRACDDLVRALVKGLPVPPVREARRPPAFGNVLSDGTGRVLKLGDTVTVIAQGQPGAIGSFDIVPLVTTVTMEEQPEGIYVGRYAVKPGQNATDVYVVARLADSVGRVSEREDLLGRFAVDTMPPATPAGLTAAVRDGRLRVAWTPNGEPDLAAYRVYRSDSALTGFTLLATTETPAYRDELEPDAHYQVAAVDRAGNESAPSATVTLPILASPLRGSVSRESYLAPARSPYLLEGSLTVEGGATLHVLPGVVVRLAPGAEGIVVKDGMLVARATAERRILFTSASERPQPGDYRAAVQIHAKAGQTSVLDHVRLEHAAVAVKVESGALEILRGEIIGNRQAGVDVGDTGALKLTETRIAGHTAGAGVAVSGFGRAALRGNHIIDNGWAVVNYSGNQVDARGNWWGSAEPADSLFVGDVDRRDALTTDGGAAAR